MELEKKKCVRKGCMKKYTEDENTEGACSYHPGKPIFHDLKKGWTCCNKIVYDWDEFQKLPGCESGKHTDTKEVENKKVSLLLFNKLIFTGTRCIL